MTPPASLTTKNRRLLRLKDGRLVCFLRIQVNPSGDAKNMVMIVSEDAGFSWTPPKWTNIWGYPAELIALRDGRYLMIYGYRRPPYGVPGQNTGEQPASTLINPVSGRKCSGAIDWANPGVYQHIGYPSVVQLADGTIVAAYHEWSDDPQPIQFVMNTRFRLKD